MKIQGNARTLTLLAAGEPFALWAMALRARKDLREQRLVPVGASEKKLLHYAHLFLIFRLCIFAAELAENS